MERKPATRDQIATLVMIAGLELDAAGLDEVVAAYQNIEPMLWRIPRGRDRADEPAHTFDPRKFVPDAAS